MSVRTTNINANINNINHNDSNLSKRAPNCDTTAKKNNDNISTSLNSNSSKTDNNNSNMNEEKKIDEIKTMLNEIDASNFCVFCARYLTCDFNYNSIKTNKPKSDYDYFYLFNSSKTYKPSSNIPIKCLFCSKFITFYLLEKLHDFQTNLIAKFGDGKLSFYSWENGNNTASTKEKEKTQIKNQKHYKIQDV